MAQDGNEWKTHRKAPKPVDARRVAKDEKLLDELGAALRKAVEEEADISKTEAKLRKLLGAWRDDVDSFPINTDLKKVLKNKKRLKAKISHLRSKILKAQRKKK